MACEAVTLVSGFIVKEDRFILAMNEWAVIEALLKTSRIA
jgi:hypothetical protein